MQSWLQAWLEPAVSAGHGHLNHFACAVRVGFSCVRNVEGTRLRAKRIDAEALRNPGNADAISSIIRSAPHFDWSVSAHEHAAMLTEHLYQGLVGAFRWASQRMRRACFTEASGCVTNLLLPPGGVSAGARWHSAMPTCAVLCWLGVLVSPVLDAGSLVCMFTSPLMCTTLLASLGSSERAAARTSAVFHELQEADSSAVYTAFREASAKLLMMSRTDGSSTSLPLSAAASLPLRSWSSVALMLRPPMGNACLFPPPSYPARPTLWLLSKLCRADVLRDQTYCHQRSAACSRAPWLRFGGLWH